MKLKIDYFVFVNYVNANSQRTTQGAGVFAVLMTNWWPLVFFLLIYRLVVSLKIDLTNIKGIQINRLIFISKS